MEAVPRLPMISFDLKVSPDRFPPDYSKLKHYIRDFYNEDPETYSNEIRNLETLRANAVHPPKDATGCAVLKKYFCQLHFLQSRFPIGKDEAIGISFTWKDTYGGMVCTVTDIKFEMVCILYNIGALHSILGAADDRTTPEGLKMACTHFQCAAWAFQHLKDSFPQSSALEILPDLMQFMYHLCLAQAQECILEKSMMDNRKATINAKVAAQIVDYYNLALNALLQGPSEDGAIVDVVGSKLCKSWKKYMKFKVAYYNCVALLYQGMQSEEQQKMGERIAYYQASLDKLNEAIKLSKGIDQQPEVVMEALIFTRDVVEGKRKGAKNENDFIYHEDIPEVDMLPPIKGASLVKGIPFNVNDPEISGPDIFSRLVPMKAIESSSLYSEEKAKLLRRISAMIDSKDEELVSYMSSLQLEYLKAHLQSKALPQEVVDRCAALSAKPDAIQNLIVVMDKLTDAYHDVDAMLKEIMELIKIEEANEKEYQEVMGGRPPSIVATDLTREANKYMEAHKKAAESNETLHKAMTQHVENLRVLQQPLEEIVNNLPNLESLNLSEDPTVKEVNLLVDKVGEMKKQRATLASQLRESICSDDITTQLVTRTDEKKEDIFQKEMQKHNKYVSLIEQNLAAQDNILPALTDAYAKYAPIRKAVTEIMRQREMMLSALISSYDAYEDLIQKSNKGLEFYRKLETNLTKLLQRVKGTCKVQQEERETILTQNSKKVQQSVSNLEGVSGSVGGSGLKLKDYLQNRKLGGGGVSGSLGGYYSTASGSVEAPQSWLPAVRPAPLGSESVTTSLPDGKAYPPASYGAYPATSYLPPASDPNKYIYPYQNPLLTDLQNLQYPTLTSTGSIVSTSPNVDYRADSTESQYQYGQTSPSPVGYGQYAKGVSQYPAGYPQYQPGNQSLSSQCPSETANRSVPQYPVSQPPDSSYLQYQTSQAAQPNETNPNASSPYHQYSQYGTATASGTSYLPQYDANQATPSNQYSTSQSTPTKSNYIPSQSVTPSAADYTQYQAPVTSSVPQYPAAQQTNQSYDQQYNQNYQYSQPQSISQPQSSQTAYTSSTLPEQAYYPPVNSSAAAVPTQDYNYYYSGYYANTYPQQQFQRTPGTDVSCYSSSGGKTTLETNSTSLTPEGLSYASQYVASTVPSEYHNYYNQPYGYQFSVMSPDSTINDPTQHSGGLRSSVTYVHANSVVPSTPTQTPGQEAVKQTSNVDLLAGLDFNIKDAPLQPQQSQAPQQPQPQQLQPPHQQPQQREAPNIPSMDQTQQNFANLSVESKPVPQIVEQNGNTEQNKQNLGSGNSSSCGSLDKLERPSPSKTPLRDPFSDPEALASFVQEVDKFEKFVEGLNCKTLNGPTPLDLKWNELQDLQEREAHKQIISVARCYPMKNRYPDILPYDSCRVELPSTKDDYINASHVKELRPNAPNFIVTQAPLPSTYSDFWNMVLENHVELIVCLLSDSQMNGEIYWAMSKSDDLILGKIKISLQSMTVRNHWVERIMSISDGKSVRVVIHLQFTLWPQSWMPESPGPLLALVGETLSLWGQARGHGPVVVHCDSGIGRSGIFVLSAVLLTDLKTAPHLPDPLAVAAQIGRYRKNPLRDRAHLDFAYHCTLYHARDLLMKRGILASRSTFDEKRPKTKSHTRHPSEDFLLTSLKEHGQERRQSDASSTGSVCKSTEADPLNQIDPLWPIKRYS